MDLRFDVYDDHTRVISGLRFTTKDRDLPVLSLNAKNREIISVTCSSHPLRYEYNTGKNLLHHLLPGRSPHVRPLP